VSIYATLWALQFPKRGDYHTGCQWQLVLAQAVPWHVGEEDDSEFEVFLPSRHVSSGSEYRAVVIVKAETKKGTERCAQEYVEPLLVLAGAEYSSISFELLREKIAAALRGSSPRVVGEFAEKDGSVAVLFEDGTRTVVPRSGA
jgi:hypothetical protein